MIKKKEKDVKKIDKKRRNIMRMLKSGKEIVKEKNDKRLMKNEV